MREIQKKIIKIIVLTLFIFLISVISNKVYAKSYSITNMDIQATILEDGSINVKQSITYDFNGNYNGIYITIPCNFSDKELEQVSKNKKDSIYNGTTVLINDIKDSNSIGYLKTSYAYNGNRGVYTLEKDAKKYTLKVYSPSNNVKKTFILDYDIKNICVKYSDVGELYYNFIGGEWDVGIEKLNIDIHIPNNTSKEDLYVFGHGPYNGQVKIISENKVNFNVTNIKKGQYVAVRVVFNKNVIKGSTKTISKNALSGIMQEEQDIYNNVKKKKNFTWKVLIFAIILFIYWIVLLVIFERDKKYIASNSSEEELFKKYNPLIAGCIQGSREILARDIIAVILNLIDKKIIKMEVVPVLSKKDQYKYNLYKVKEREEEMDEIEEYVYKWLFNHDENVELVGRLKKMSEDEGANLKFKKLNEMAKNKLNGIGANVARVPFAVRLFNEILFVISIILVYTHIGYNAFSINMSDAILIGIYALVKLLPIAIMLLYLPAYLLVATRHRVNKIVRKFSGQKVATTSISIILLFIVIIILTACFVKTARFLIVDELLICITLIIMFTDNLMLKNDVTVIEDFSKLNMLKSKLQDDSLFEERDLEQVILWGKYLAYGVAFGASSKIAKRMKELNLEDDLEMLLKDNRMLNNINSGYNDFYRNASLDRRFVRTMGRFSTDMLSSSGRGGFSRRKRRRILSEAEVSQVEAEEAGGRRSILKTRSNFMSIRLVYGRAGTGKSTFCLNEIKKEIKNQAQKTYIIVPEQFSYATEKKLLETLEEGSSVNAEVISFKRLAYRVNSEVGGVSGINLTKAGKAMLVENIVNKNKDNLNYLNKTNEIDLIIRTITEIKKHNISEEQLKIKTNNKLLELKLEDINTIFSNYQEIIKNSYIDEEDKLSILASQISKSTLLDNSTVYIDEFAGFTPQEYLVIEEILKKANMVTITICTDELHITKEPESDVFYPNKLTVKKLIEHAKNAGAKVENGVNLNSTYRFKTEELSFLEQNIYSVKHEAYKKEVEHIHLNLYNNPYEEIEETAKKIIELVRKKGIRYKDISIIAKNIEEYISIVNAIFSKYNIPVYIDSNKGLSDNILIKYILAIFQIFAKGWSKDSVISYVKTGFTPLSKEDIYKLENYVSKWQIRGNKWYKEDWKYDELNKDLEYLNTLRKQIIEPLQELNNELKNNKTAEEISKALYNFLEKNEIKSKLNEKLESIQNEEYTKEYISSYNTLIDILDEIAHLFGKQKFTFEEYYKVLKAGLEVSSFGEIPEVIDEVTMGDVERSRSHKINTVFILGLNDGVFPSGTKDEGFLNDSDREILKENGIELAKGTLENLFDEEFNIYKSFATAENEMYLSYVSCNKEGKAIRPSILITKIKKIFPKLQEESNVLNKKEEITCANVAFTNMLSRLKKLQNGEKIDIMWADVFNWYKQNKQWKEKIDIAIKGFEAKNKAEKISARNITRLYGKTLKTSISRLEQYKKCPFSFHLKYGLKLKEKEELRIKPVDTGSFMHDVIDTFFENVDNVKEISEEEIEKNVDNIINEKLSLSKNYIFTSTPKFIILTNRLKKVIMQSIKFIVFQIQNSDFNIVGNEVEFKRKIGNVEILGKIDRLDELNTENGKYLRIIDYKSSEKNIDLNEFIAGTQIQLITYLDSQIEQTKDAIPAGMLYFKMIDPIIKESKNLAEEEIKEELKKRFKMSGMILADINIIKKMDRSLEKGSSAVLPVYLDKDGNISKSRSNVITKEEFTKLQKKAQKIIIEISNEILSGNIDIKPVYSKKKKEDTCKYCEYKSICRFNPKENEYAFIENKTKEEILDELKK